MNKKLLCIVLCAAILAFPAAASAHVFIKGNLPDTGAILHVTPDDDPIAGEQASLFFDIQSPALAHKPYTPILSITDDRHIQTTVPATASGNAVNATYAFPLQGVYRISLVVEGERTPVHEFTYTQRVSRGTLNTLPVDTTPAWAQAGLLFVIVTAIAIMIVFYNRRTFIRKYSK
ncbi:MAG TPA: hypothetical protein VMY99_02045 [Nevskiaceae bacterium]|nr:hypothetical protein [Nevskiaceae bacterium]